MSEYGWRMLVVAVMVAAWLALVATVGKELL